MKIALFVKRYDACYYIRARIPSDHLTLMGHEVKEAAVEHQLHCPHCGNKSTQEVQVDNPGDTYNCKFCFTMLMHNLNDWKATVFSNLDWCDVAFFQRNTDKAQLDLMREAKRRGKFVVTDADDDYINIPVRNSGAAYYRQRQPIIEEMFRVSDAITVTTKALKNVYLPFNKNIEIIPNAFDVEIFDVTPPIQNLHIWNGKHQKVSMQHFEEARKGRKFLCWAGSPTHDEDLEIVTKAIEWLIHKENIIVGMCAFVPRYMVNNYPTENLFLFGVVPNVSWYSMLKYLSPDVWIAPVVKNEFNRSKSNLKKIESAMMGSAFVGSNFDTYNSDDLIGFLPENESYDWRINMRHALNETPEERALTNQHNREVLLRDFDIKVTVKKWESFFKSGVAT